MRLTAQLTAQEVKQLRQILWAPHYRLNLFNNYTMATGHLLPIMLAVGGGSLATAWTAQKTLWNAAIVGCAFGGVGLTVFCYLLVRWHHVPTGLLRKINATVPEWIEIGDEGLEFRHSDGAITSVPWHVPKGWRCGSRVAAIEFVHTEKMIPLPLAKLSTSARKEVMEKLTHHLGDPDFFLAADDKVEDSSHRASP